MAGNPTYVFLAKSLRAPIPGSKELGNADSRELMDATVHLRSHQAAERSRRVRELAAQSPRARRYLTRAELAREHGARAEDVEKVKAFAADQGLAVTGVSAERREIRLRGTLGSMCAAFQTNAKRFQHASGGYRARTEPIGVPTELAGLVEGVLGFDTRPFAHPHFRRGPLNGNGDSRGAKALTGKDLAQIYNFPDGSGAGEVIAIIELEAPHGSGYRPSELTEYFKGLGVKPPRVIAVSVDGGFNGPGTDPEDPQNADGQVMLDIEVAGAVAPAAQIVVYFAPNTARGFADVIKGAVYDKEHNPTVIALGWGATENPADSMYVQIEQALEDAVQLGVTFCVASGSSGSRDDPNDRQDTVVGFPASHPYALGCGGTRLEVLQADVHERVWEKHSGGGVSRIFPLPDYQADQSVPPALNPAGSVMRGVPDVAGSADPETGYQVTVDGASAVYGGTSAVAALWAGLVARLNEQLGSPVGLLNPILYQYPCLFRDIVTGSNIDYHARKGWDPCTGLGTPDGKALLAACVAGGTGTGPRTPSRA